MSQELQVKVKKRRSKQGDQIGQIFAHGVIDYLG
jgi:hypothetical protein